MFFRQRRPLEPDKVVTKAQPQRASLPYSDQSDLTANQHRVLSMQHLHGNRAVLRMLTRSQGTVAQRAPEIGWHTQDAKPTDPIPTDPKKIGPNQKKTDVWVDPKNHQLGSARRIPVRGLDHGTTANDPAGMDWLGNIVSSQTKETAKEKQAIVIIPDNLDVSKPVGVLLHLQGNTIGYRDDKSGKFEDMDYGRIEQQLRASDKNMIGILPQGALPYRENKDKKQLKSSITFGDADRDKLIDDVFKFLSSQKLWVKNQTTAVSPTRGPLVFSSHSGGAFTSIPMLGQDVAGKDPKTGNLNPQNMAGVILFDSIHKRVDDGKVVFDQAEDVKAWLAAQMTHDMFKLIEIAAIAQKAKDDDNKKREADQLNKKGETDQPDKKREADLADQFDKKREADQLDYLSKSMHFRGIYTDEGYKATYAPVRTAIDNWFKSGMESALKKEKLELSKTMSAAVIKRFQDNYQVIDALHKEHIEIVSRGDQLKNALTDIQSIGSTTPTQTTGSSNASNTAPGVGSGSGSANVQKKAD